MIMATMACSADPEPNADELGDVRVRAAEADEDSAPIGIQSVKVVDLLDSGTAVLVSLNDPEAPEVIPWDFQGEPLELNDAGGDGDEEAGDGVYTGVSSMSIQPLLEARMLYTEAAHQQEQLRANTFAGHRVSGVAVLSPDFLIDAEPEEVTLTQFGGSFPAVSIFPVTSTGSGAAPPPLVHDPYKTLMIIDPDVVYNPDLTGRWENVGGSCTQVGNPDAVAGFRFLMGEIANGTANADEYISEWLAGQASARTVNDYDAQAAMQGIYDLYGGNQGLPSPVPWPKIYDDGNPGTFNDILDGNKAPLQLIAIVNRFDLVAGGYGSEGAEAELRFVFTFIDEETCEPANGNIILEYAVPLSGCGDIEHWAKLWAQLDDLDPSQPEYWAHLSEQIILPVVSAGAGPGRPNESNLKVLRTNEQVLSWPHYPSDFPTDSRRDWRMEEWAVDPGSGLLANQVLAQTPGFDWVDPDTSQSLPYPENVDLYIDTFQANILAGTHSVPLSFNGSNFASPQVRYGDFTESAGQYNVVTYSSAHNWRAMSFGSANVSSVKARQQFSLTTCSGCHAGEAFEDGDGSAPFNDSNWNASVPGATLEEPLRHVRPDSTLGSPAHLSRFLTGTNTSCSPGNEFVAPLGTLTQCVTPTCCPIGDPVFGYQQGQVHFNEFARRGGILEDVLLHGCGALETASASAVVSSAH